MRRAQRLMSSISNKIGFGYFLESQHHSGSRTSFSDTTTATEAVYDAGFGRWRSVLATVIPVQSLYPYCWTQRYVAMFTATCSQLELPHHSTSCILLDQIRLRSSTTCCRMTAVAFNPSVQRYVKILRSVVLSGTSSQSLSASK